MLRLHNLGLLSRSHCG